MKGVNLAAVYVLCLLVIMGPACAQKAQLAQYSGGDSDSTALPFGTDNPNAAQSDLEEVDFVTQFPSLYRGWDYLAAKLRADGVPEDLILSTFQDSRMKDWTPITFALQPREHSNMYVSFARESSVRQAFACLQDNADLFSRAERRFGVSRHVLAALLFVETHCGRNLGESLIIERLVRVASVAEQRNIEFNLASYDRANHEEVLQRLKQRAAYLEETFYPEVRALFETARVKNVGVFELRGSSAGAFGIPQFLPSSYLRFGIDADGDGKVSLFEFPDAVFSAAFYLKSFGWIEPLTVQEKRAVLWNYNRSDAYGDAVLKLAVRIKFEEGKWERHPEAPEDFQLASSE